MTSVVNQRFTWAVEKLSLQPGEHVLEIGCGHGIAAALVAEKLTDGRITAIDRSRKMIDTASAKYQAYMEANKAVFMTADLDQFAFDSEHFDKIFAINVNVFWTETAAAELAVIRKYLRPDGALYLFYQPPRTDQIQGIVDQVSRNLEANQFAVNQVIIEKTDPVRSLCIIAKVRDKADS